MTHTEQKSSTSQLLNFNGFVNECWMPTSEAYTPAMSDDAKRAIKSLCEDILIREAYSCNEDSDESHTYENYLNECGQYMTECMMRAAQNLRF